MALRNDIFHSCLDNNMGFGTNNFFEPFVSPIIKNEDLKLESNYGMNTIHDELISKFISKSMEPTY